MVNGIINTLVAFLMGGATLSFSFTATDAGGAAVYEGEGTTITCGEFYRMETPQLLIVSDGISKGIYQKEIDEIVLQPVAQDNAADMLNAGAIQGVMDNPFALLKDAEKYYQVTTWKGGKKVSSLESGLLPDKIELKSKNGAAYTIRIMKITKEDSIDKTLFTLDPNNYPTAIVTDLR